MCDCVCVCLGFLFEQAHDVPASLTRRERASVALALAKLEVGCLSMFHVSVRKEMALCII